MHPLLSLLLAASWGYGTPNFDGWPPVRFTGDTTATVHFLAPKFIIQQCDGDPLVEACSFGPPNEIYAPNPCDFDARDNYARLLCHEIAHLDGWPGNHPR